MANWSAMYGGGGRPPTSIVNAHSSGGASTGWANFGGKQYLSGALTANTYATILSLTGSGVLCLAAVETQDATARTIGLQIIIDGVTVYDAVSNSISAANNAIIGVGMSKASTTTGNSANFIASRNEPFNSSCVIKIKSSLSETDKIALYATYDLT